MAKDKQFWAYVHDFETEDLSVDLGDFDDAYKAVEMIATHILADGIGTTECAHVVDFANHGNSIWVAGPKPSACIGR